MNTPAPIFTPFRTVLIFVVLSLGGVALLPYLPVNLNPQPSGQQLQVRFSFPGAPPQRVEMAVSSPLENAFSSLQGVEKISSVSRYDGGQVELTFNKGSDLAFMRFELASLIRQLYPQLPEGVSYPEIDQPNADGKTESPLLVYSFYAPFAIHEIASTVDFTLLRPLRGEVGVARAEIAGTNPLEVQVLYDPEKLRYYGLGVDDVQRALAAFGSRREAGMRQTGSGQAFFVSIAAGSEGIGSTEQLAELAIAKTDDEQVIRLRDLARVVVAERPQTSFFRINGKNAVRLLIYAREGSNRLALGQQLRERVSDLGLGLPKGYAFNLDRDDTAFLAKEMDKIYTRTLLSIGILLGFILLVHRNLRYLAVLVGSIAVTLCLSAIGVYALGISVHLYSLAGVTISFGLIVDSAIMMTDQLHRHRDRKIFLALLAASLTTACALLMVFFLPESERQNLTEFAAIIALILMVSLVTALWFTPAAYRLAFGKGRG